MSAEGSSRRIADAHDDTVNEDVDRATGAAFRSASELDALLDKFANSPPDRPLHTTALASTLDHFLALLGTSSDHESQFLLPSICEKLRGGRSLSEMISSALSSTYSIIYAMRLVHEPRYAAPRLSWDPPFDKHNPVFEPSLPQNGILRQEIETDLTTKEPPSMSARTASRASSHTISPQNSSVHDEDDPSMPSPSWSPHQASGPASPQSAPAESTIKSPESEVFKTSRITIDDPCYKVLPVVLKKYNIASD